MAKSDTPRRIVHVTEAPLGGVVTYLDELLSLQIKMMPDTAIDLITPSVNRPALEHLQGPNFTIIDTPMRRGSQKGSGGIGAAHDPPSAPHPPPRSAISIRPSRARRCGGWTR